jgi:hypothetical protein
MKGIMFKEALLNAIIQGKKTQTRRIIKPQPQYDGRWYILGKDGATEYYPASWELFFTPYRRNEILYIKEPYYLPDEYSVLYKYDYPDYDRDFYAWKNKMFMPAKYARHFIKIKNRYFEKLHDITKADAIAEGVSICVSLKGIIETPSNKEQYSITVDSTSFNAPTAVECFAMLWNHINGKDSYKLNPWVWVYDFEIVKNPK